jgi:hypothetical protein
VKKISLAIILLGLCKPILGSDVLSNNEQRKQAVNQFLKTEDPKVREAMVPIVKADLENYQKNLKKWIIGYTGCALLVATLGVYGAYKYPYHSPSIPAAATLFSLACLGDAGMGAWMNHRTSKFIKNTLDKKNKTQLDWYKIKQAGRYSLFNNYTYWNSTGTKSEDVFTGNESCELYNQETKQAISWNMNDPNFVKNVFENKYNAGTWMLRKKAEDI